MVFWFTKAIFRGMSGRNEYKSFKELRDAFFTYTRAERNGIYVLAGLLILVCTYKLIDRHYWVSGPSYTPSEKVFEKVKDPKEGENQPTELFTFDPNTVSKEEMLRLGFKEKAIKTFMNYRSTGVKFKSVADFERVYSIKSEDIERVGEYIQFATKESKPIPKKKSLEKPAKKEKVPPTLFEFDPNSATESDLVKLGLPSRVIKTMLKFRSKGRFWKASDVAKIYGLNEKQFEELLPYIRIEPKEKQAYTPKKKQYEDTSTVYASKKAFKPTYSKDTVAYKSIDINKATNEEWQRINGIGPTYAKMINRFRGKLGGFYSVEQIGETYGLPDSVFQMIVPYVKESSPPFKIPINLIPVDSLARHPYLTWKQAKVVINYRAHHGPYKGPEDVAKVKIFTKEKWESIIPYLEYRVEVDTFDHGG